MCFVIGILEVAEDDIHVDCSTDGSLLWWILPDPSHSRPEHSQASIVQFQQKRWHLQRFTFNGKENEQFRC